MKNTTNHTVKPQSENDRKMAQKSTLEDIKMRLSKEFVSDILAFNGFRVDTRTFMVSLSESDKTPSSKINDNGTVHSFNDDFHGDIFDVLQTYRGMDFKQALEVVKSYLGVNTSESNYQQHKPVKQPIKKDNSTLSDDRHKQIVKAIEWYDTQKQLQTFTNPDYKSEMMAICPLWVFKQADKKAIDEFRNITTYDFQNKTLVIKICDYQGKLISYKRRQYNSGKWVTTKDTHPNKQCLVSIKSEHKHIYIVEGHHDFLTAILLSIDVLMIPTVNYKKLTEYELSLMKNRDVILIPDFDIKNVQGVKCMKQLSLQVDEVSKDTKVFSLPRFLEDEHISFNGTKLDLSEVVELWSGGLDAFVSTLEYRADKGLMYKEEIF